jgi:hypothetical protein
MILRDARANVFVRDTQPPARWALRTAVIAVLLLPLLSVHAYALNAFWQGQRSAIWEEGSLGGVSNWYDMAAGGSPLAVPDGVATFTKDAVRFNVTVAGRNTAIRTMLIQADAPRYSFTIANGATLTVRTSFQNLSNMPSLMTLAGRKSTLKFKDTARFLGAAPATITNNGIIEFADSSRGGNATINNNMDLLFKDGSSADGMTINNSRRGNIEFATEGRMRNRVRRAGVINNAGTMRVDSKLKLDGFTQNAAGQLTMLGAKGIAIEASGTIRLDGHLVVRDVEPKRATYVLLRGAARRGQFDTVTFASFPLGWTPTILYRGSAVVLRVSRKP